MSSECCTLSCSVLTWKDAKKSGAYLAAINAFFLAIFMDIPLFTYFLTYFGLAALVAGAYAKFGGKLADEKELPTLSALTGLESECVEKFAKSLFECVSACFAKAAPIIFWQDVAVSGVFAAGLYVFSMIIGSISLSAVGFFGLNGLFFYGKFQKELKPHIVKIEELVKEQLKKIPVAKKN